MIASRSSTTARVSRKVRSPRGRPRPKIASTARAKAMSVAVESPNRAAAPGIEEQQHGDEDAAGAAMPPTAASTGTAASRGLRRLPATSSCSEFHANDEEEDGQQAVGGPCGQSAFQVQRLWAELGSWTTARRTHATASLPRSGRERQRPAEGRRWWSPTAPTCAPCRASGSRPRQPCISFVQVSPAYDPSTGRSAVDCASQATVWLQNAY